MQLSKFSDYALRTLMHLAVAQDGRMTTRQIAEIHDAKYNHFAKVTQWLVREGYVSSLRGRTGGLCLAMPIEDIRIGPILRDLESTSPLVDCLSPDGGTCRLAPSCGLTSALRIAQEAFFDALDQTTLAQLVQRNGQMAKLLLSLSQE